MKVGSSRKCGSAVVTRASVPARASVVRDSGSGAPSVPVALATCTCGFACGLLGCVLGAGGLAGGWCCGEVATCSGVAGRIGRGITFVIGANVILMGACSR